MRALPKRLVGQRGKMSKGIFIPLEENHESISIVQFADWPSYAVLLNYLAKGYSNSLIADGLDIGM